MKTKPTTFSRLTVRTRPFAVRPNHALLQMIAADAEHKGLLFDYSHLLINFNQPAPVPAFRLATEQLAALV